MKIKSLLLCFIVGLFAMNLQAQDLGSMMNELANGIKPEAYKDSFNKDEWVDNTADIGMEDLSAAGEQLTGLVNNLKPEAFNAGSMGLKKDLLSNLANLKDPGKLVESLKSLVNGLNPSMLASGFNKEAFLTSLGSLM